ncbi:MAG: hypothetical protein P4M13_07820 [Alphaproteobacteria bacterium]|nr:hypothetical protein [Alphaproteobacteria bacterium]
MKLAPLRKHGFTNGAGNKLHVADRRCVHEEGLTEELEAHVNIYPATSQQDKLLLIWKRR